MIDITNQRFGRLLAIEIHSVSRGRMVLWKCLCDCGNTLVTRGSSLRGGRTKSCGCLAKESIGKRKPRKKSPFSSSFYKLYDVYRRAANRRELPFNLSEETLYRLTQDNCKYCGAEPQNRITAATYDNVFIYNGVDRVDNNKGYIEDNCVSCCKRCNIAKASMTIEEFDTWLTNIYFHYFRVKMD